MKAIYSLAAFLMASPALGHDPKPAAAPVGTITAAARPAVEVVDAFQRSLNVGNGDAALAVLADDVLIFENGGAERSKAEYAGHHLGADMAFAQAVPSRITARRASVIDNLAWITSEGRTTGSYKGKPVDNATTETMVLRRDAGAWKIVHIHWSSAKQPF